MSTAAWILAGVVAAILLVFTYVAYGALKESRDDDFWDAGGGRGRRGGDSGCGGGDSGCSSGDSGCSGGCGGGCGGGGGD